MIRVLTVLGMRRGFRAGTLLICQNRETTLKKWLKEWGLKGCRVQAHTKQSIAGPVTELRRQFPTAGAGSIRNHLRQRYNIHVSEYGFLLFLVYSLVDDY